MITSVTNVHLSVSVIDSSSKRRVKFKILLPILAYCCKELPISCELLNAMVVSIRNKYVTITINSNTTWFIKLSLSRALSSKCSDLLSTLTEDGDAVSYILNNYDLSPLVDCHPLGDVDTTNGFDRGTKILNGEPCDHYKWTSSDGHSLNFDV